VKRILIIYVLRSEKSAKGLILSAPFVFIPKLYIVYLTRLTLYLLPISRSSFTLSITTRLTFILCGCQQRKRHQQILFMHLTGPEILYPPFMFPL
jgi:hypothetical protein